MNVECVVSIILDGDLQPEFIADTAPSLSHWNITTKLLHSGPHSNNFYREMGA